MNLILLLIARTPRLLLPGIYWSAATGFKECNGTLAVRGMWLEGFKTGRNALREGATSTRVSFKDGEGKYMKRSQERAQERGLTLR